MLPVAYAPNTFSFAVIYDKQYLGILKECSVKLKKFTDDFSNSKVEFYVLDPTENNPYVIFQCIMHISNSNGGSFCEESEYVESSKQVILHYISGYIDGHDNSCRRDTGIVGQDGVKIYEGDIISYGFYEKERVIFRNGRFCLKDGFMLPTSEFSSKDIKVHK